MRTILPVVALLALAACSPTPAEKPAEPPVVPAPAATAPKPPKADIPAGDYTLDKTHSTLVMKVNHLGFSNYTAAFASFDAKLKFDQNNAAVSSLEATIDPRSLTLPAPPVSNAADVRPGGRCFPTHPGRGRAA